MVIKPTSPKEARRTRGLTMAQAAVGAGISTSTLSRIESGFKGVKLSTLAAVARVVRVPLVSLVAWLEESHAEQN